MIDTPGVRSFGLAHVSAQDLLWAFPDLEDGAVQCPRGCEHLEASRGLPARRVGAGRQLLARPGWPDSAGCCCRATTWAEPGRSARRRYSPSTSIAFEISLGITGK